MNLSTFDLNLLRVLDALLREPSTVKAAQRVRRSQPAVSAALRRLRHALNDPLFVRQGQRLVPTDYAKSLEVPLRQILEELTELLSGSGVFHPAVARQRFKIAGSDFFAEMLMPSVASLLGREAPGIQIQLVGLQPDNLIATLETCEVDMALIPAGEWPGWVASVPVFQSRFVVIAREDHPVLRQAGLRQDETIPIDLFCELGHAVFSPAGKLKAMGDAALARMGRERRVVITLATFGGICQAVSESDLVALLPEQLARKLAPSLGLVVYAAPMRIDAAQICMAWHKRDTANPAHRWLRTVIAQMLSKLDVD